MGVTWYWAKNQQKQRQRKMMRTTLSLSPWAATELAGLVLLSRFSDAAVLWEHLSPNSLQRLSFQFLLHLRKDKRCLPAESTGASQQQWLLLPLLPSQIQSSQNWLHLAPVTLPIGTRLPCLHHMLDLEDLQRYHGNSFCLSIGENVS